MSGTESSESQTETTKFSRLYRAWRWLVEPAVCRHCRMIRTEAQSAECGCKWAWRAEP